MSPRSVIAAFIRRDWQTDVSYRAAFVLDLASMVLLLAIFFYLGQGVVDSRRFAGDQGLAGGYFAFVAIGLALFQVIRASLSSFSRKLREEQTTGTLEALLATPASPSLIILASAAYDLLRATVSGFAVILVAVVLFGLRLDADAAGVVLAFVAFVGSIGLFASLGVAIAAFTVIYMRAIALLGLVLSGLGLLGGVYFPVEVLPEPIQSIAQVLPFTWGLDVIRAGLLGGDVDAAQLLGLFGAVVVMLPASLFLFGASLRRARRSGTLAQY